MDQKELSILFWLKKSVARKAKDGMAPISIRLTIDGDHTEISLGKKVLPEQWDSKEKIVSSCSENAGHLNKAILQAKDKLKQIFTALCIQFCPVTPHMVKNVYEGLPAIEIQPVVEVTMLEAFTYFNTRFEKLAAKGARSKETLKKWRTNKTKVAQFIAFQFEQRTDVSLRSLPISVAEDMLDFLMIEQGLCNNTAMKYVKDTKQVLKMAVRKGWLEKNPMADFVCTYEEPGIEELEMDEVLRIYHKVIDITRLEEVRDVFIFQCFTGFAYQDLYALRQEHIITVNGERWLKKPRGKTGVKESVPLLPIAEQIIAKYANHPYCLRKGVLLPVNSNARYNGYSGGLDHVIPAVSDQEKH